MREVPVFSVSWSGHHPTSGFQEALELDVALRAAETRNVNESVILEELF